MDLFFLKALLRGKLVTTSKFEETLDQVSVNAKRYREVEKSDELKEFLALEKKVNAPDFLAKKKEITETPYKKSEEYKVMEEFKKICKDQYVRKYLRNGSEEGRMSVQRFMELKAKTEDAEFQKRDAFWKNPKRWETTEEGKMEERYNALKQSEDIIFFLGMDVKNVEKWEQFELAFEDDFEWAGLSNSQWKAGFVYPNDDFKHVHSYSNEKQAYNNGRNVETSDSILTIRTRKEAKEGPAWDAKKGMIMKEFPLTSDAIYTDKVAIEEGSVVQVKCRCRGLLNHGIYLRSKSHVPFISLFDYTGRRLYCGVKDSLKHDRNLKMLDGLQPITQTIFTVSWQKDEIVWFVNNLEVYRTANLIPKGEKLYLNMYSFAFEKERHAGEGELNVDWVRVYNVKK
ncbi:MAG: hypothetical protein MJZ75_02170 [Paludibacteraceae bacterium]|nr:hypothetical protein [Paludibacteraceae bacterium]